MDYRLTDPYLDVSGDEVYVERPVRLKTYFCYEKPYDAPAVAPLAAQQAGHVTFGCLNDYSKLTAATWDAWRKILAAVEGSTLLVHAPPGSHRELVRGQFAADGIDPQRLNFVDRLPREQYMAQYNQIDIALDPFPYPGGLTTCDALWMGVPVVSLAGSIARRACRLEHSDQRRLPGNGCHDDGAICANRRGGGGGFGRVWPRCAGRFATGCGPRR